MKVDDVLALVRKAEESGEVRDLLEAASAYIQSFDWQAVKHEPAERREALLGALHWARLAGCRNVGTIWCARKMREALEHA